MLRITYILYLRDIIGVCIRLFLAYYEGDLVHLSMVISFIDRMNEA